MQPLRPEQRHCLLQYIALVMSLIICATDNIMETIMQKDPEPYHTSILSGEGWVIELLTGHPERIHCELGMHGEVFRELISVL